MSEFKVSCRVDFLEGLTATFAHGCNPLNSHDRPSVCLILITSSFKNTKHFGLVPSNNLISA